MNKVIDVSEWQGRISDSTWSEIKKKVNGVIIRLGYRGYGNGALKLDSEFTHNLAACKRYGIPYGVYFYSQAINAAEGQEEVSLIAKYIDVKACELGVWCDSETSNNGKGRADVIGAAQRTTAVKAFINAVNARGGHGGLYCGFYWLRDNLIMNEFSNTPFWLACYMSAPLYKGNNLYLWQFTSLNGFDIAGFGKSLDCSWQYKGFGTQSASKKSVDELAHEVLDGKWGNGKDRVDRLTAAGYDYNTVQKRVNELIAERDKPKYKTYVVRRGDTLSAIARRYNTTVAKLAADNGIKNPNLIYPGQVIKIY